MIDRDSSIPLYEQIKQVLREKILNGDLTPDMFLPTEQELCEQYNVSRITIKRTLDDLAKSGLVKRIQGKGTFVAQRAASGNLEYVASFSDNMRRQGLKPTSQLLSVETRPADVSLRRTFDILNDSPVNFMCFRRLLGVSGRPVAVLTSVVPEDVGNKLLGYDIENCSFYQLFALIRGRKIARIDAILTPTLATRETVQLLGVDPGSSHFHYRAVSYLEGDFPIELSIGIFSGDFFQWKATFYELRDDMKQQFVSELAMR